MGSTLLDDYLAARQLDEELVRSSKDLETRIEILRRIYREHFAETTVGNPGEFQAVMVMLTTWGTAVQNLSTARGEEDA